MRGCEGEISEIEQTEILVQGGRIELNVPPNDEGLWRHLRVGGEGVMQGCAV